MYLDIPIHICFEHYFPANANHKFEVRLADVNSRVHCGNAIRAVSENRDPFQSRGKDTKLAESNERRAKISVISLICINYHSSIVIGASYNSPAYFPVFSSFRNCRNCWKAQTCLETCNTARISSLGWTTWPVMV